MYSKIISPEKDGKVTFNNKGSSACLGNYLEKELNVETTPNSKIFFNNEGDFTKTEMVNAIDNNVKGLTADDDKFYSLVLSPSQAELEHIGNDIQKLRKFTIACMENYAQNFNLKSKDGTTKSISEKDLLWFANIEHERTHKGHDTAVKQGQKKQGERKEGLQTHIHITVSARDKAMKVSLNPRTNDKQRNAARRFSILAWSEKNQALFNEKFGYDSPKKSFKNDKKEAWNKVISVEKTLFNLESKYGLPSSDCIKIRSIATEKDYSQDFRTHLKDIAKELRKEGAKNGLKDEQWEKLFSSKIDERRRENSFDLPEKSKSFDVVEHFNSAYYFFKGAELSETDMNGLRTSLGRAGANLRKRLKNNEVQQANDKGVSM